MLVSIVVTTYNNEQFILACLESIRKQTYKCIEVIIVDDGSNDNTGVICDDYIKKDERFRVIHKKNGGAAKARCTGAANSNGIYIMFVDGDDWIENDMIAKLVGKCQSSNVDIVTSGMFVHHGSKTKVIHDALAEGFYASKIILEQTVYPKMICCDTVEQRGILTSVSAKIFKNSIIKSAASNVSEKVAFANDFVLTFPAILEANSIYITHDILYHYNLHDNSTTTSCDLNFIYHLEALYESMDYTMSSKCSIESIEEQLLQVKIDMAFKRGVNNAYKQGRNRFTSFLSVCKYNWQMINSNKIRAVLQQAPSNKNLFTPQLLKIIRYLLDRRYIIAAINEYRL